MPILKPKANKTLFIGKNPSVAHFAKLPQSHSAEFSKVVRKFLQENQKIQVGPAKHKNGFNLFMNLDKFLDFNAAKLFIQETKATLHNLGAHFTFFMHLDVVLKL